MTNPQDFLEQCSQTHKTLLSASQKMGECFLETFGDYMTFGSKHFTATPKTAQGFVNMCYEFTEIQANAYKKASNVILDNLNNLKDVTENGPVTNTIMNAVKTFTEKTTGNNKTGGK